MTPWLITSWVGAIWTWPALIIGTTWSFFVFSVPGLIVAVVGLVGVLLNRHEGL